MTRAALNALLGTTVITNPTNPTNPTQPATGAVSAMVASDNPAAGALINSQATAKLLAVNLTGSGTVTSVTLQRTGISDQNTLANVYLFDGNTRITDGYSFNINGQIVMNGLNIAVNGSHEISVRADVASNANATASSIAVALTGLTANGTATTVNVQGNSMQIVTGSAASVTLSANTVYTSCKRKCWSYRIHILVSTCSGKHQSCHVKTANFRMIGSAPIDALANIKMFIDGVDTGKVATVITINGSNYASFDLTSSPII